MKWGRYIILALGAWLLIDAVQCQRSGVARAVVPGSRVGSVVTAKRDEDPKGFENLMRYQWSEGALIFGVGIIVLLKVRREDSLDPFSVSFAGSAEIDELERCLGQKKPEQGRRDIKRHIS
jgi:hypothetical protein